MTFCQSLWHRVFNWLQCWPTCSNISSNISSCSNIGNWKLLWVLKTAASESILESVENSVHECLTISIWCNRNENWLHILRHQLKGHIEAMHVYQDLFIKFILFHCILHLRPFGVSVNDPTLQSDCTKMWSEIMVCQQWWSYSFWRCSLSNIKEPSSVQCAP